MGGEIGLPTVRPKQHLNFLSTGVAGQVQTPGGLDSFTLSRAKKSGHPGERSVDTQATAHGWDLQHSAPSPKTRERGNLPLRIYCQH